MPNIKLAKEAFGPKGGLLITLGSTEGLEDIRPDVKAERILLYTAGGVVSCHVDSLNGLMVPTGIRVLPRKTQDTSNARGSRVVSRFRQSIPELFHDVWCQGKPSGLETRHGKHTSGNGGAQGGSESQIGYDD